MSFFLNKVGDFDFTERLVLFKLPLLIAHFIAGFFLLIVISYFVYKPFRKWLEKRENHLKEEQNSISKNLKKTEILKQTAIKAISENNLFMEKISSELKQKLEIERKNVLELAFKEKKRIIDEANLESKQKKTEIKKEIEKAIIVNSFTLMKKMLNSEIDHKKHQDLINDFLNNLEKTNNNHDKK